MEKTFEQKMDDMLFEQAKKCAEEGGYKETEGTEAKGVLSKFLKYIKSLKFDLKCRRVSLETGVPYKIIKNQFVANVLGKIADILGLTIILTGNVIEYAVLFIANIIANIVSFGVNILNKIINIFTFNCGSMATFA